MMNTVTYSLPDALQTRTSESAGEMKKKNVAERIWKKDPKLWKENPAEDIELSNRLGWLKLPEENFLRVNEFVEFAEDLKNDYEHVMVLGMGGSSLAPEVFAKTYGSKRGYPDLTILDSTHPAVIKDILENRELDKTLFVVASKSGGTAETMSFYYTIYDALANTNPLPGLQMVVLTDPGSSLEKLAIEKGFRKIFNTPPEVGGRFSALSEYGIVPASLIGMDIRKFLTHTSEIAAEWGPANTGEENPGLYLGVLLGEAARAGIDKLTFISSKTFESFPQWVEQLIAESTGKEEKGILPVADEPALNPDEYGKDRMFVYLRMEDDDNEDNDKRVADLKTAGFPVIEIRMQDAYGLAEEFYRWEYATAVSGIVLGINPFDQPNVQLAKTLANQSLAAYKNTGVLPKGTPFVTEANLELYAEAGKDDIHSSVGAFFIGIKPGDYIAVMAFLKYGKEIDKHLNRLRERLLEKFHIATTLGYGPRFLHSTGQLHKGGANNGYFIQITDSIKDDVDVPGQNYTFGTLVTAQAQGDMKALAQKERRVIRIHITGETTEGLQSLIEKL